MHSHAQSNVRLLPTQAFASGLFVSSSIGFGLEVTAAGLGTFPKQMFARAEYRQSRVPNATGILVNVVVSAVVDASAYALLRRP